MVYATRLDVDGVDLSGKVVCEDSELDCASPGVGIEDGGYVVCWGHAKGGHVS